MITLKPSSDKLVNDMPKSEFSDYKFNKILAALFYAITSFAVIFINKGNENYMWRIYSIN